MNDPAMLSVSGATAFKTPQKAFKASTPQIVSVATAFRTPQEACKVSTPQNVMAPDPITSTEPTAHYHFYHPPDPIEFDDKDPLPVSARFFSALKKKLFR